MDSSAMEVDANNTAIKTEQPVIVAAVDGSVLDDSRNRPLRIKKAKNYESSEPDVVISKKKKKKSHVAKSSSDPAKQLKYFSKQAKLGIKVVGSDGGDSKSRKKQKQRRQRGRSNVGPEHDSATCLDGTSSALPHVISNIVSVPVSSAAVKSGHKKPMPNNGGSSNSAAAKQLRANAVVNVVHSADVVAIAEAEPAASSKPNRPNVSLIAHKILNILFTNDPMSLPALVKHMHEVPKEVVHSIIEVLYVMGIVQASRLIHPTSTSTSTSSTVENTSYTAYCSLMGYSKGPYGLELSRIEEDIVQKVEYNLKLTSRMKRLEVGGAVKMSTV